MGALPPVLLRADNFTPVARTPWGGTRIVSEYKRGHLSSPQGVVGESWEVSIEPDFPARIADGSSLLAYLDKAPREALGIEHERARAGTALLVKLIDTAEPLSVQIHPSDSYARLLPAECGKPESWYVVDRAEGAGLYLGFRPGVDELRVRRAITQGEALDALMHFVEVEPGDFFVIDAGVPHAIGAGLTLVEPQHVLPGRRGLTYRYWDWNRRYDAQGKPSPAGATRPLHVEDALAVTDWRRFEDGNFISRIRLRAGAPDLTSRATVRALAGGDGLASEFLAVSRIHGTGSCSLPYRDRLQSVTVLTGSVMLGELRVERGRSAVVPACAADVAVNTDMAHAIVCAVA